ncbi:hypothetical protein JSQ81_15645 [Sporosarcina sp. Marseille-Q4063]|uniref:hypothetical protein n=1 Tax=Sporosarcina sp. Marseille-Q4063 TaxID=2810514 RepID=UPI001BAEE25C|nr:hypothetical protein [Sporosarcina sp. Marseille-Q4063]QUW21229.1 hypothetical protein JSQ81_15645 [Sporosarcina sp. Marseille-Q4063]
MKDKLTIFKIRLMLKRILIVVGALFLSISIGSGVKSAFAGQDINSVLTNWFNAKKTESINQIDKAITNEKELLMAELKKGLQTEIQLAEDELAQFTQDEIALRVDRLRSYADDLLRNMSIDNSDEQAKIAATLNAIYEQALEQMNVLSTTADEEPDNSTGVEDENAD